MTDRRFAAVLSIDVVGYSRLMQEDAPALLSALNGIFRKIVRPSVARHGGKIVKLLGDGALVEFSSAANALASAVEIQKRMQSGEVCQYSEPIRLRVGLHAGDVFTEGDDIFGDPVIIATRLQAVAEPGGILLSRIVRDLAGDDLPVRLEQRGTHSLKNIRHPVETFAADLSSGAAAVRRAEIASSQEIRFCKTHDGLRLAWTETGSGAPVVKAPNWIGHLELDWRNPGMAPLIGSVSGYSRFIRFDARANGLSDWEVDEISFERFVDDLGTVFDAAGIERAPILAISQGCAVATAFAARAPERVSAIVMFGGFPLGRAKRPSAADKARAEALKAMMQAGWDDDFPSLRDLIAQVIYPGASTEERRQYAEDMREIISPENIARYRGAVDNLDVTELLPAIEVPCLVLHSKGDRMQPIDQGRAFAAGLPNARFIALDSDNHCLTENDPAWPIAEREIREFLTAYL